MGRRRAGSDDPVRDPPAYLAGMLRRPSGELRPDVTLGRIERRSWEDVGMSGIWSRGTGGACGPVHSYIKGIM